MNGRMKMAMFKNHTFSTECDMKPRFLKDKLPTTMFQTFYERAHGKSLCNVLSIIIDVILSYYNSKSGKLKA